MGSKSRGRINSKGDVNIARHLSEHCRYDSEQGRKRKNSCSLEVYKLVIYMSSCYTPENNPLNNATFLPPSLRHQLTFSILNRKFYF